MDAAYSCEVAFSGISKSAKARIGADSIMVDAAGREYFIYYADIDDFRLLNYHLFIYTKKGEIEFSKLGRDTENFFEKLWLAYDAKSRASLFLKTEPLVEREGDYAYTEDGVNHIGKAKIALYEDSLCILPHDSGARRIPLCFVKDINSVGYNQLLRLDTGEEYRIGRLGYDTKVFSIRRKAFQKRRQPRGNRPMKNWRRSFPAGWRTGKMNTGYSKAFREVSVPACSLLTNRSFILPVSGKEKPRLSLSSAKTRPHTCIPSIPARRLFRRV